MDSEARKYFKYLHLVREDIREEFERLEIRPEASRVCDFGCGSGIFTFGLALEMPGAACIGLDLFGGEVTPEVLGGYIGAVRDQCQGSESPKGRFPAELCRLVLEARSPRFVRGDIVGNENLPANVDLAYCKKLLVNLMGKDSGDGFSGEEGLRTGLEHIRRCIQPGGLLCVIEYDRDFGLAERFETAGLVILRRARIERREIRSRGRTNVTSTFALYLCQRVE
jgi:SAM-dependent methyltransferase